MVRHMEKGDVAETEEVNTAIDPDEVYENRGESAAIDKDTDKLKVSTDDQPSLITSVMSKDKEAETGYNSQGEIGLLLHLYGTLLSQTVRDPPHFLPDHHSMSLNRLH